MLPAAGLLVFFKLYVVRLLAGPSSVPWDEVVESDLDEEEEDDKEKVGFCRHQLDFSKEIAILKLSIFF